MSMETPAEDTGTAAYSNPVDRTLEAARRSSRRRGRGAEDRASFEAGPSASHAARGNEFGPAARAAGSGSSSRPVHDQSSNNKAASAEPDTAARYGIPDGHGAVSSQHGRGHFAEVVARVWRPLSSHAARSAVRPTGAIVLHIRMLFPADRAVALESGQPFCFEEIRRCVGDRQSRTYH
ncbi:hypothetical protein IscW_ISCW012821 [Ixodes scapularis]|uniref:Uncharacterized protein n=1 Tax=Ixodes scapularis TaxID=6945 RepID=B7QEI1_IXOSC|nr:hypothetical protein IscW_ISCW012821 [Ixodes scapularis]|eukprot:XP_002413945.1 hypothetical protein IscW_ISCW012821 [Ixodes scapularis]